MLGNVQPRSWVGATLGCKSAMLPGSRSPLHPQERKCAPSGEAGNPGPREPKAGLSQALAAQYVSSIYTATIPTSFLQHFLLRPRSPGQWMPLQTPNSAPAPRDTCP